MKNLLVAGLVVATSTGCGGGKSPTTAVPAASPAAQMSPPPAPPPAPATLKGFFNGTISTGRSFAGFVLEDGTLYGIYAVSGNSQLVAGLIQGNGTSSNNTSYSSSNIKDFSLEGLGVRDGSLSGTFDDNLFFNGTVTYANMSFAASMFNSSLFYTTAPTDLSTVAGNYSGNYGVSPGLRDMVSLTISPTGAITAIGSSGCRFTGQVLSRSVGSALNLSLTFASSLCSTPSDTFSGIATYNGSSRLLYGGAPNSDRSKAAVFILMKQ